MIGELRDGRSRLHWEKVWSKVEGWVMELRASGTSPRKALCHETEFGFAGSDGEFASTMNLSAVIPSLVTPLGKIVTWIGGEDEGECYCYH